MFPLPDFTVDQAQAKDQEKAVSRAVHQPKLQFKSERPLSGLRVWVITCKELWSALRWTQQFPFPPFTGAQTEGWVRDSEALGMFTWLVMIINQVWVLEGKLATIYVYLHGRWTDCPLKFSALFRVAEQSPEPTSGHPRALSTLPGTLDCHSGLLWRLSFSYRI